LHSAFGEAAERGCELHIVHAWVVPAGYEQMFAGPHAKAEVSRSERRVIEDVVNPVARQFPTVPFSVDLAEGNPAHALKVASERSDLLLLARRRHAFPVGHIGGTARELLHHSSCPVEVLAAADEPEHLSRPA
jgi:nucleotide-binding universal stress UspA family protein